MTEKYTVTFQPDNRQVIVEKGETVLNAANKAGIYVHNICGGDGICGKCRVIIKSGDVNTEPTHFLKREEIQKGYALACTSYVENDLVVEIPAESKLEDEQILVKEGKSISLDVITREFEPSDAGMSPTQRLFRHGPLSTKLHFILPKPSLSDTVSDLERIYREIRRELNVPIMQTGLAVIKKLSQTLRDADFEITATLGKRNGTVEIFMIEPGDTSKHNYGLAIDIGTTTIVVQLVDLISKKVLSSKASTNKQTKYGDDVISRMIYAGEKEGLEHLHDAAVDTINRLVGYAVLETKVNLSDITTVVCAGNTTMAHMALNVDPTYIRKEPYVATTNYFPVIRAAEAGIRINPRGLLSCIPGVSSYVGGDITAGVLASGLFLEDELAILLDVGTNGEVVLGNKEWLVSASCSAGPCFEGAGVKCGMRAAKGAVEKIEIEKNFDISWNTIGNSAPRGICGSGMIDMISEFVDAGIINKAGKFDASLKTDRLRQTDEGLEFVIANANQSGRGQDIVITQADITNILRSKAAIFAGIRTLIIKMGLSFDDVKKFYIAGGFGNSLNIPKAIGIGMLPDLPHERYSFIGNSSLAGAKLALLSYDALKEIEKIAEKMTYIELSADNAFMEEFMAAIFLPHTDSNLFPSLRKP
ncbi:MAG: DUF4445 domain-containing protein [Planctomycetes bacterium]|nr:DUF4445 domain-containing protein [Planctomycetota bacterium]